MTVHALSHNVQSHKSDVLSYSACKIVKKIFATGPHWEGLTTPPQTPQLHNGFSPHYGHQKTGTPKKTAGYSTAHIKHCSHFHRVITKQ